MTPTEKCTVMRDCIKMAKDVHGETATPEKLLETAKDIFEFIIKEK